MRRRVLRRLIRIYTLLLRSACPNTLYKYGTLLFRICRKRVSSCLECTISGLQQWTLEVLKATLHVYEKQGHVSDCTVSQSSMDLCCLITNYSPVDTKRWNNVESTSKKRLRSDCTLPRYSNDLSLDITKCSPVDGPFWNKNDAISTSMQES